eukprot:266064-Rhodomonas_salina.1
MTRGFWVLALGDCWALLAVRVLVDDWVLVEGNAVSSAPGGRKGASEEERGSTSEREAVAAPRCEDVDYCFHVKV